MPHLVQVHREYEPKGLVVIGVTYTEAKWAEMYRDDNGATFPILADAEKDSEAFGIRLIYGNAVFLVDPNGKIVTDSMAEAEDVLVRTLGPARSPAD